MIHIKLITYMRKTEYFNSGLQNICDILYKIDQNLECVVFTDEPRDFFYNNRIVITNQVYPGTKYVRLLKLINEEKEDCLFISIDNDMLVNDIEFTKYVKQCIELNVDFSWARLMAQNCNGIISKLIAVDKLLSHNLIRPLLWKSGLGLSIPGQCFIIKPKVFKDKLYEIDTFLDDLALGAFVNENFETLNVYISNSIIGYEFPNNTFMGLCRQRKRWAKGFFQVLQSSKGKSFFGKVCVHGIVYHGNWLMNWLIALIVSKISIIFSVVYICFISGIITYKKKRYFFWGILYQIVFPVFHIVWTYNLIRGEKNNDNA